MTERQATAVPSSRAFEAMRALLHEVELTRSIELAPWTETEFLSMATMIQERIDAAVAEEREACAKVAEKWLRKDIAKEIRARGE